MSVGVSRDGYACAVNERLSARLTGTIGLFSEEPLESLTHRLPHIVYRGGQLPLVADRFDPAETALPDPSERQNLLMSKPWPMTWLVMAWIRSFLCVPSANSKSSTVSSAYRLKV